MLVAQATSKQVSKNISTTIMECLTKQMQIVYEQAVTHIQAMTTLNLAQLILISLSTALLFEEEQLHH